MAPCGSRHWTIQLPPGNNARLASSEPPLSLPDITRDNLTFTQAATMAVRGVGPDGVAGTDDDVDTFLEAFPNVVARLQALRT